MTLKMTVTYNNKKLSDYLYVTADLNRDIIGDRTNTTVKVGHAAGEVFLDTTRGMKKISMPFHIDRNDPKYLENIAEIINVNEPKRLIFGDEPEWYYNAIPDGALSYTQLEKEGSGTITWIIPDGYKHAIQTKTFTNAGGVDEIPFDNLGNVDTPISIEATMKSDNGFMGFTLGDNYYQIGIPSEVDGEQLPPSEHIVPNGLAIFDSGKINDTANPPLPSYMGQLSQTGTIEKTNNGIQVKDYGTSAKKSWAGPSITWTFPRLKDGTQGAKNFFLWQNVDFETWKKPEAGFQVHTVLDENHRRLITVLLLDQSGTTNQSKIIVFINDKRVYEANNNWTGVGYRGFMSITKSGSNFVVVYGKTTKTFLAPDLTNNEGFYYSVGFGKWFNNPAPTNNWIINWNLRQDKIDSWIDIPNFLKTGDVIDIDSAKNKVTINGASNWDRTDVGSSPLFAEKGKNILGVVKSDFATMPDVKISFNERKL